MNGFAPLVSGNSEPEESFKPLSSVPGERIDFQELSRKKEKKNSSHPGRDESQNEDLKSQDNETEEDESPSPNDSDSEKSNSTTLDVHHPGHGKPKVTLHRENGDSGKVTGVQLVCSCGEVIDLAFQFTDSQAGEINPVSSEDVEPSRRDTSIQNADSEDEEKHDSKLLDEIDPASIDSDSY